MRPPNNESSTRSQTPGNKTVQLLSKILDFWPAAFLFREVQHWYWYW